MAVMARRWGTAHLDIRWERLVRRYRWWGHQSKKKKWQLGLAVVEMSLCRRSIWEAVEEWVLKLNTEKLQFGISDSERSNTRVEQARGGSGGVGESGGEKEGRGRRHYGKHVICRVQKSLPSAKFRALGRDLLYRAPHSAKYGTQQRGLCQMPGTRQRPALDKGCLCRVPGTRQRQTLGKVW